MAFRKSSSVKIGGKFLATGESGSGKSYFTLTFPRIGAIDSEVGLAHYENREIEIGGKKYKNLEFVDNTADLDEIESDLDDILNGEYDDKIDTFAVDSETKIYNNMTTGATEETERKAKLTGKNADQRKMWAIVKMINHKTQQAKITLSAKGKHIVSVAQGKYTKDDDTGVVEWKIDAHSSLKFDYDTVLRFFTEKDKKTGVVKYYAEVLKDRSEVTKVGDIIENCTFDIWKDYYDNMMKSGESVGANYSKDVKTSTKSVQTQVEKNETLAEDIKTKLKSLSQDKQRTVKSKIDELEIDIKQLAFVETEKLNKLNEFIDTL